MPSGTNTMLRAVALLVLCAACAVVHGAPKWDWSQPVKLDREHDPSMVALADGRDLSVRFDEALKFEDVDKWPTGKALVLGYRDGQGVVLFDADSGKSLQVVLGVDPHPIDLLLKRCLDANGTTLGDIDCYVAAQKRWDAELNRAYKQLMGALDEQHQPALRTAQQQWLKFRDAERAAIDAVYDREGTLWKVVDARHRTELVRERALKLVSLYDGW